MSYQIITDTASNILKDVAEKWNISVIPLTYIENDEECHFVNTDDFDFDDYYKKLSEGVKVTTSQVNPAQYEEVFTPFLEKGEDILFIGLSSGVSGSYNSAVIAAEELAEEYPERKICIVDSLGASLGEGILVVEACKCREKGMSIEETEAYINAEKVKMYQIFVVDDLNHLKRTGRLFSTLASIGTILNIKIMLKGNPQGKIVITGQSRGRKQAIKSLAQRYKDLCVDPENQVVGLSYGGYKEDADTLAEMIKEIAPPKELWMVPHEPGTGAHVGPGMLALYFLGNEDIRNH